jgi:sulfatase maturation enzyme AslB (radical SAM superfamily)
VASHAAERASRAPAVASPGARDPSDVAGAIAAPTGVAPILQLHPTRRCNIACAHCYSSSGPQARDVLGPELLLKCIEDAAELGYRQLAVSGGEPLLYGPLEDLLRHARAHGMVTTVTTNGMLATQARWGRLAPWIDVAAISVDGRPDEHDAMRRRPGAFARTCANLQVVRESGVAFALIFTLTQHNADSIEFVVRLAADVGARSVHVHPLTLHGRAITDLRDERPDSTELIAALAEGTALARERGVAVHVDALTQDQLRAFRDRLVPSRPVLRLTDVSPLLIVGADGVVMPLTHEVDPAFSLGSLRFARLRDAARRWLESGTADRLAGACERTWTDLAQAGEEPAVYWYECVAARTRPGSQSVSVPFSTPRGEAALAAR